MRLNQQLHDGRALLLDLGAGLTVEAGPEVAVHTASAYTKVRAMLVRPDGFVAWATEATCSR
ncbi:hypothetical protein [Dactylosporangium sp. CA-233914]|uniref:aromatic-ring hydroxylase C-terminal domain-containing protein n=1 Tax=Dactylosporangium sp. CA-233914 TaxID=3239934 RepID=UPI003D900963